MKQGNASNAMMDLDDLDRQLRAASGAPRRAGSDDPLAELARIVGQEDPLGGSGAARKPLSERIAPSFDDFLKIPPRPASSAMPSHTPPVEPLFPEHEATPDHSLANASGLPPALPLPQSRPEVPSLELGLRPALPMESEYSTAVTAAQKSDSDLLNDLETRLAAAMDGEAATPPLHQPIQLPDVPQVEEPSAHYGEAQPAPTTSGQNFDDMLAEFDAAMRDVGAEKLLPERALEPIMVPPPPPETAVSYREPSGLGMAAAGAAVIGVGAVASAAVTQRAAGRPRRGLMIAGGVIAVALIGIGSLMTFGTGSRTGSAKDAPVIAARPGVTKERPANPGGVEVPNQDKEVLQPGTTQARQAERVAPREEQPVDLNQAQRAATADPGAVRQIPGVAIVAPTSTTPPPGAQTQPVPRPVASVPITITGQPPVAVPPVAVAPAPVATAPAVPVTPVPQAAVPATSVPAVQPPPAAEPRRVRAVPIRPDEGSPTRAQAQPRVVPANPRTAPAAAAPEPEDANAPLRITPQASRAPQRAAAPAVQPGTVPASSSTPQTTQSTTQSTPAPATGGSGFTVQLAAEGSEDAARAKFNRMRGQYSETLGSQNPNIRSAEVNGRSVYRVRVGNMSREEAVSLCEKLKSDGGSCFVARN
jgi:SPOR domain